MAAHVCAQAARSTRIHFQRRRSENSVLYKLVRSIPKRQMVCAKFSTYNFRSMEELFQLERRDFHSFQAIADALSPDGP